MSKSQRKSWREKLADSKDLPKVAEIDGTKSKRWGEGTFVIPAPLEVDAAMKKVRRGMLTTIDAIRAALASKHGTTIACPLTTGIFAWIAAHAADEAETEGRARITPYWRTLRSGGELNPKYPGGIKNLRARLVAEGHRVVKKGNRYFVADFERAVVEPASGDPRTTDFAVDRITRDRVEDYARRKGLNIADVERWLAPNVGYESG